MSDVPASAIYSDGQLIDELRRVAAQLPAGALTQTRFAANSPISPHTVSRRFSGWRHALAAAGLAERYSGRTVTAKMRHKPGRGLSKEEILIELRRIAASRGRAWITKADIHQSERIGLGIVLARFGSWPDAVAAAGLDLSPHAGARTDQELMDNLQTMIDTLGRFPRTRELYDPPSQIRYPTYLAHYRSWAATRDAFGRYTQRS